MIEFLKKSIYSYRKTTLKFQNIKMILGQNFKCGKSCSVSKKNDIIIGDNFYMGRNCHLASNLIIGNNVMFASYVACVGGDHKIDNITSLINQSGRDVLRTTIIEDNVWVGHGVIILHGVKISSGSVIAAGSVVTKDVSENSIWGGNPARFIRKREV